MKNNHFLSYKKLLFSLFFLLAGIPLFLSLFTTNSFAGAVFKSDGTNNFACQSNGSTSDNTVLKYVPKNVQGTTTHYYSSYTHCAANEVCTNSDSSLPSSVSFNTPVSNTNVATCAIPSTAKQPDHFTCHVISENPRKYQEGSASPNNGMDQVAKDGTVLVQNFQKCPSWDYCKNDSNGVAQCLPDTCNCTGKAPYIGSGNNGLSCTAPDKSTVDTACSTLQACVNNGGNPSTSACQQLSCTCDHPNDTTPGNNGFTCVGGANNTTSSHDTCQSNEVCTGNTGSATCKASTAAGTAATPVPISYPPPPCDSGTLTGGCGSVTTAFGSWSTDPAKFVTSLMSILMSIAGSIAVLLIIASGYTMIMSQGDPEKIQGAKERLTAAIIGLLFLIFSVVILEIIGVNLLHLPGFAGGNGASNSNIGTNNNTNTANAAADNATLDATACDVLDAGNDPQCGLDANGSGLFCGAAGSATNCRIGGRSGVLYRCSKNASGKFVSQVAQVCPNSDCQQVNGAANADKCGTGAVKHYSCSSNGLCQEDPNGQYTTGNCNNSCI